MLPDKFPEANKTLNKPQGMTNEECLPLPVFTNGEQCISLWRMTWRERLYALIYGKVWVQVLSGQTQPPIALTVAKTIFERGGA
jgi:hypothetical protein